MRFFSRSGERGDCAGSVQKLAERNGPVDYESVIWMVSEAAPGVRFSIQRVSFGRRLELSRKIREISRKAEFLQASTELHERIEANILAQEIDAMYLKWGLAGIEGLTIDGEPPSAEMLLEKGPEELAREVVAAIKAQCGLTDAERKN